VQSKITITGCPDTASAATAVEVHITHTRPGDLVIDLISPDGVGVNLWNRQPGSLTGINTTFSLNLRPIRANGTWTLQVHDGALLNTGLIDSWTLDP
jgi:subtilisin-like proprotein convertase family protein